ncbi:J domain-containing protein [Alkalibacter mobilis]|uniref:J domain-containing protein n=1 Tax=Alkalibacter mobilis TaxID=2787712 RepID=UPI00189CBD8C|nr:DnaJ domain-containing protein [Alkalibacter mobilis]MBF7095556.1 DnaJ domain-containing protein [Alkalibacter mobilis]
MDQIKTFAGRIIKYSVSFVSRVLEILIKSFNFMANLVSGLGRSLFGLLGAGGCLFFFLFTGPFGLLLLFDSKILLTLGFLIFFPGLSRRLAYFLKYAQYSIVGYFEDIAFEYIDGKERRYSRFSGYAEEFRRTEEEKSRKERERQRFEQQRQWQETFRQWNSQQGNQWQRSYTNYGGYQSNQRENFGGFGGFQNSESMFKQEYEKSCKILNVDTDSDTSKIKSAYRSLAKKFHPDINKSADATKRFQEINDAYEFLNEENIIRYKKAG